MTDQQFNPPQQPNPSPADPPQHPAPVGQPPLQPGNSAGGMSPFGWGYRPLILLAAGVLVFAVITSAVSYLVYDQVIKEDSGIAMCKAIRDKDAKALGSDGDDKLSKEEYTTIREAFEESDYEDIREHGKALIDIAWQIQSSSDKGASSLALLGPYGQHAAGLQSACADQGIIINLMDDE